MKDSKHSMQDRRVALRDKIILSCRFIFERNEHDALITDISPGGAFLESDFLPPVGANISIRIDTSLVGIRLILKARVLRRDLKKSGRGNREGVGIQFNKDSLKLKKFINKYAKPQID